MLMMVNYSRYIESKEFNNLIKINPEGEYFTQLSVRSWDIKYLLITELSSGDQECETKSLRNPTNTFRPNKTK